MEGFELSSKLLLTGLSGVFFICVTLLNRKFIEKQPIDKSTYKTTFKQSFATMFGVFISIYVFEFIAPSLTITKRPGVFNGDPEF